MQKITRLVAIKRFFERTDDIAPEGGRKVEVSGELNQLADAEKDELGALCAEALGCELKQAA